MKKWLLAWVVFTLYVLANMTVMPTAEQPHLVATLVLGFFFYLIFGIRGVYFAMLAVTGIVILAILVHQVRHPHFGLDFYGGRLFRLLLDVITVSGGGGVGYWFDRVTQRRST